MATTLETKRLRLVPMTRACLTAAGDVDAIAAVTKGRVPASWPVEHYDQDVLDFTRAALDADETTEFVVRYLVLREPEPVVIGMVGAATPDGEGRMMIGYSVLPEFRRRGYASEALEAIVAWGWTRPEIRVIAGDTYPELGASIATMRRCGFAPAGAGEGERVIRFEVRRAPQHPLSS